MSGLAWSISWLVGRYSILWSIIMIRQLGRRNWRSNSAAGHNSVRFRVTVHRSTWIVIKVHVKVHVSGVSSMLSPPLLSWHIGVGTYATLRSVRLRTGYSHTS